MILNCYKDGNDARSFDTLAKRSRNNENRHEIILAADIVFAVADLTLRLTGVMSVRIHHACAIASPESELELTLHEL